MPHDIMDTVNVTRLSLTVPHQLSVYVSRMLWPSQNSPKKPKIVILAPESLFPYSYMASSLVHDPIMGNLMVIPQDELPELTAREIQRISPQGSEGLPPVILIGPFKRNVVQSVESLGFETLLINGKNVFDTAAEVARLRKRITPDSEDGPVSFFVISVADPFESSPAPYYSTHSGVPILFTQPDRLAKSTAQVLKEFPDNVVYVIGNRRAVSDSVINQISDIVNPSVRRIAGRNPFVTAVNFAAYHDPKTQLGWNRNRKGRGDAFTFTNIERWDLGIAASSMAHHGKHTPLLLIERNEVPQSVKEYLEFLRPPHRTPPMPPFMHSFVLGNDTDVSFDTQAEINDITLMEPME